MSRTLLVLNPNTTEEITGRMVAFGQAFAPPGVRLIGRNGRFGARYISDRPSFAVAAHAALDAFAAYGEEADAVLIACFGDPGLLAMRELAGVPVGGMAEAAFAAAAQGGRRFSIVTGGVRWRPMLGELARDLGYGDSLAGIETLTLTGGQIAADPDGAIGALAEAAQNCVRTHGADVVILGGAGLVGLAEKVRPFVDRPVICSVSAGFEAGFAALDARTSARDIPPIASIGLSPELAALMARPI